MSGLEGAAISGEAPPPPDPGSPGGRPPDLSTRRGLAVMACAIIVIGLETLAYLVHGPFEGTAARLWALGGCGFVGVGVAAIARAVAGAIRDRCLTTLIMAPAVCFVALWGITGVEHVQLQHEATQEVAAGLGGAQESGWNYTGVGHLGYPNRQYLIAALPSLFLGRGLLALRLGFALPFLFGAFLFWAGARDAWSRLPGGGAAAALATLSVPAFPYAIDHLRWYEQTIFPLAATLAAAGWLLIAIRRPSVTALLGLAWIGALLGCSYTPALASSGLLGVTLLWLAASSRRPTERRLAMGWMSVAAITVGFAALSFITRLDLFKEVDQTTVKAELAGPLREAFAIFLFEVPKLFIPPALYLPIMAIVVLGLVGRLQLPGLAIAWWTLAVVATTAILRGYADPPPSFGMHRALVVIPPLLLLTGWTGLHCLRERAAPRTPRAILAVLTILVLVQVAWNLASLNREYRPTLHEIVLADMIDQGRRLKIARDSRPTVVLLTDTSEFDNISDYLVYFYPGHRVVRLVEEAADLDRRGSVFVYADADAASSLAATLPWLGAQAGALIEYEHPEFPRRMLRWALNRVPPGASEPGE